MKPQSNRPQFIVVYRCSSCGMESGMSDLEEPKCFYCDESSALTLVSKEPITPESLAARLKASTDNMMNALRGAYGVMSKEDVADETGKDPEKEMLELLATAQALRDQINSLELREEE